ncbi:GNAT family N-acetyltransferase [Nocardioides speluncae]|uniref:GNAT family N-acetyltransferase n=1 Tax=Nocardioides speluncae TaxID=2670337 RepID=UPI000D6870C4|nr:GNAT family protein [Nocardioides speluncae]
MTNSDVSWPQRTERLLLRRVTESDIDRLLEFRNDPEVYRWLLKTEVDKDALRDAWMRTLTEPGEHSSLAELDGTVIGTAGLVVRDGMGQDGAAAVVGDEAQIGYILDPAYGGRGYGTEIASNLLRIAFEDLGVRRVVAGCFADNTPSWRVLEKVGMRREQHGVQDSWHAELGWVDGYTYGILADEWRATRS